MGDDELSYGRFQDVSSVEVTGSTNDDLAAIAAVDQTTPRVLFAEEQTAGRGRLDRSWDMARGGGLMVSFFVPWTQAQSAHLVPIALGVAAHDAVAVTGRSVGLKWPNDLVISRGALAGKKLGGMLSASVAAGVVTGLGCNVSWPPLGSAELPGAAALDHLDGEPVTVRSLGASLIEHFDRQLGLVQQFGADPLLARYRDRCVTIGQDVRVETPQEHVLGRATDIDPTGALLVEVDGQQHTVAVGDVVHLRPPD